MGSYPKGVNIAQFSLVKLRVYIVAHSQNTIWDTPLPPSEYPWSEGSQGFLCFKGPNHLSQGVRHRAEGCMALGWLMASVANDPLGAPGSTPLYSCLSPVWVSAGGDFIDPHYSCDIYGLQEKQNKRSERP
jgi:hypothetical protein